MGIASKLRPLLIPSFADVLKRAFPLTGSNSSFLNSSLSIHDHRARVFMLSVPLDRLHLPTKAKEKFIRLVDNW